MSQGIKIQPTTAADYKNIIRLFDNKEIQYHTCQLLEDKELKIVIRGLYRETDPQEILEDLKNQRL